MSFDALIGEVLVGARAASLPSTDPLPRRSRLWDLREGLALGDVSIKKLIAEGRE
jgi:hypothetical protein